MRCVDTQVLIWGIKRQSTPNRVAMIERAEFFIEECRRTKTIIMIPSVVLAEFLAGYSAIDRPEIEKRVAANFFIAPFDAPAAAIAADIWSKKAERQRVQAALGTTRETIKADIQIVATAIAHKARRLLSEDGGVQAFSIGRIICEPLPVPPPTLFNVD